MKRNYNEIRNNILNANYLIWGCGNYLKRYYNRFCKEIQVEYIYDKNEKSAMEFSEKTGTKYVKPEELENVFVIIAVESQKAENEIEKYLDERFIDYCHLKEILYVYNKKWEQREIEKYRDVMRSVSEPDELDRIKMFASISVPVETCNLRCSYCYISQNGWTEPKEILYPSAQFVRCALSRKRMGGTALLNFCGNGETLLCNEIIQIIVELLKEGHYISIITNAVLSEQIEKTLTLAGELADRLFFKCSFHYLQLREKKLLQKYCDNITRIRESGASYSIELVPTDELIPYIEEIKRFSSKEFGALPHVTVARDERIKDMPILTDMSKDQYLKIWSQFDSEMFRLKMRTRKKQDKFCWAGDRAILFSIENGDIFPCPGHCKIGNIYENICDPIPKNPVGCNCVNSHCINAHAYLALGLVPEIEESSYLEMRDRSTSEGNHWVNDTMRNFISQRICDNY